MAGCCRVSSPLPLLLLLLLFRFECSEAAGGRAPALFVFGDSLVDAGNNNHLRFSVAKANFPHNGVDFPDKKPTGRFSNGKNAADFLAEKLGLPLAPPYLSVKRPKIGGSPFLAGVSFASGGAGIFNGTDQALGQSIPLYRQVGYYVSVHQDLVKHLQPAAAQAHLSSSLFAIVIGSNDLFDYFGSSDLRRKNDPQQYAHLMATRLKEQLERLYDHGARKFLLVGVGEIGCIPAERAKSPTEECNQEANLWCAKYNEALTPMLHQLQSQQPGFSYSYFDNYSAMRDITRHPSNFGFREVKAACCGLGKPNAKIPCLPISRYCSDRAQHFFWDRYGHPTEAASRIFVDLMFDASSRYTSPINAQQLVDL